MQTDAGLATAMRISITRLARRLRVERLGLGGTEAILSDIQLAALWLSDFGTLRASAARARRSDVSSALATDEALAAAEHLRPIAERVRLSPGAETLVKTMRARGAWRRTASR